MVKSFKADNLAVNVYENREAMGRAAVVEAVRRLNEVIAENGGASVVFAAAPSQNEFLASLKNADVDWRRVTAFHMDEYVGLDPAAPQGFGNFLRRAIFDALPFAAVYYIDGNSADVQGACAAYARLLEKQPPDLVFLGIGENGHLAFNDPSVADFDDPLAVKQVKLEEACRMQQVHDGCFARLEDVPTHAITLTLPSLMRIPCAITVVPGKTKAIALEKTVGAEVSAACPSTILRRHPAAVLYADSDSAALLLDRPATPAN